MFLQRIVVYPRRTEGAETAALHLQLRPGTDGALALGLIHILMDEELYDADFVNRRTVGVDELRHLAAQYALTWVAEITGVPVQQIIPAARLYATSNRLSSKPFLVQLRTP